MKRACIISLALFSLLIAHAGEKNLKPRFEQMREIEGSFIVGDRGRIVVPGNVFGQSRNCPADLRILADDGTQWPFFLYRPKATSKQGTLNPEVLNCAFVSGRESYLRFDLVVPKKGGETPIHNQVELITSGHDFVRRVEVFDEEGNALMAVGHLIDFSGQRGARNTIVRYPASDASRLHVRIYSNAQNAGETVALASAKLHYRNLVEAERERVIASEIPVPQGEQVPTAQTRMFDLGDPNRPLEFMVFDVQTPSFARSVSVYGRNEDYDSWAWVGGGEIHALQDDEQMEIKLHATHRFIKLHVFHHDDRPLSIQSIRLEAIPRYLVFEAASAGKAGLYYRAWDFRSPRYDLKGRIETKAIASLPEFQLQEAAPNAAAKSEPWRKYSKLLGGLAVAVVSLLVIGIIVSMLKQQKAGN